MSEKNWLQNPNLKFIWTVALKNININILSFIICLFTCLYLFIFDVWGAECMLLVEGRQVWEILKTDKNFKPYPSFGPTICQCCDRIYTAHIRFSGWSSRVYEIYDIIRIIIIHSLLLALIFCYDRPANDRHLSRTNGLHSVRVL